MKIKVENGTRKRELAMNVEIKECDGKENDRKMTRDNE